MAPKYVKLSVPVPPTSRAPWYKNTFPTYIGIFLWVGFYLKLAAPTIGYADVGICLWGLLVAGFLCFALYYYVPAMLGMQTGHPLYVVGTSTFGTTGGYLMPGLLMGFLQIGWVAIKGIRYVSQAAKFLNWVPLIMILMVFWANREGISHYQVPHHAPLSGFLNALTIVIGFFATAGAAGADFGMNNRNRKDIILGGICGIVLGALIAGGLPILSVAGYLGRGAGPPSYDYTAAIASVGALAPAMFFLFAAASLVPTCFSSFIASNSFSTILPKIPRSLSTLAGVTISAILAITGVAKDLVGFFTIVGASFSPICGAMAADYLLAGKRWSGPRLGINWAGYIAWAIGFLVGIPDHLPGLPASWVKADNPSVLYSFGVGFVVYLILARAGLRPPVIGGEELAPGMAASGQAQ